MKAFNALALFSVFVSVTLAVPLPVVDKGKGKAVDPPTPDSSRPSTPEPPLDHPPLPGRSGFHTANGVTTIHVGDDNLPGHMRHLQRNQALHPENLNPMTLASSSDENRRNALHGIPTRGDKVRDEKLPAMFHNPNHEKTTTVEYRDKGESSREGALMSGAKAEIQSRGKDAKGQMRPNPGWLPLDPSQRRGHEAPAKLNSEVRTGKGPEVAAKKPRKKVTPPEHHPEGYTPETQSGMSLRHRPGKDAPPPPKTPAPKKPAGSQTNLQKGTPAKAPGHVFQGTSEERPERASHHGAPAPPSNSHERQPPRPQNQEHHERLQAEAKKKSEQSHAGPSQQHHSQNEHLPTTDAERRAHANLQAFNQRMGAPRAGDGHGHPVEAPARLSPHTDAHTPPHTNANTPPRTSANTAHTPPQAPNRQLPYRPPPSPKSPSPANKTTKKK